MRGVARDVHTLPESHAYRGTFGSEAAPGTTHERGVFALRLALRGRARQVRVAKHQKNRVATLGGRKRATTLAHGIYGLAVEGEHMVGLHDIGRC